jgi:GT2 family glycosyltransferase
MKFSIIIPVKELNDYLKESVPKILEMDYSDYEIIILPNEIPEKIPEHLSNSKVKIVASGRVSPAVKRDMGAERSKGEFLAFIDDDAYPDKDWLKLAEQELAQTKAEAVCGPAITPTNNSLSQKASGLFFETLVGGGGMSYRYKPAKKSFYVDDYPTVNLIVSKKAFFGAGGFDNEFWPGEDTKFCLDFVKKGYRIWYSNKLIVWHHRRKLFVPHLKQVGSYGKHRGYFARKFPETSFRLTYFIPSAFLAGNIGLAVLSVFNILFLKIWLLLLAIYFTISAVDIFARTKNIAIGSLAIITVYLTHLTYGAMFAKGMLSKEFRSELR